MKSSLEYSFFLWILNHFSAAAAVSACALAWLLIFSLLPKKLISLCVYINTWLQNNNTGGETTAKKRWITQLTSSLCRYIDPWFGYYYCFSVHWSCSPTLVDRYQEMCQTMSDVSGGWWLVAGLCSITNICIYIPCLMDVGNCCLGLVIRGCGAPALRIK